jgi:predicted ester cyclase
MSPEETKAFIRQYFDEVLSGKDKPAALVNRYVTDEQLKHHIALFEAAFPGYSLTAEDMIAEGDKVVVRTTFRGTHNGDFMGIPPTGKQVTIPVMLIYRIADDKIVQHWMQADSLSLLQQLGAIPAPASAH